VLSLLHVSTNHSFSLRNLALISVRISASCFLENSTTPKYRPTPNSTGTFTFAKPDCSFGFSSVANVRPMVWRDVLRQAYLYVVAMRHDDPEKRQNDGIIEIFFFLSQNEIKRTIVGCRGFSCHVVAYDVIGKLAWYCNTCFGGVFFSPQSSRYSSSKIIPRFYLIEKSMITAHKAGEAHIFFLNILCGII
jgi:hypothetical protein